MKGILIEKRLRKSVIMDQNGRFVKTKTLKGWREGDEVSFVSTTVKAARNLSIAAAFVLVFALGLFAVYASNAYIVNLDVNPSIEIKVNAFNNVSEIKALNDDAAEIEAGLSSLVGMKFGPAVYVAVQLLIDEGYLEEDGTVVLSIEGKNRKLKVVEKLVSEALAGVDIETEDDEDDPEDKLEAGKEESGIKIYVGRVTEEMAEAAEGLGVPIGRIVLAEKAQEEGAEISYEMAAVLSVQELQRIRNLAKTINKATEILGETSGQSQDNGKGKLKQVEAMSKKILREASKIEGNIEELAAIIASGTADAQTTDHHAVLSVQLENLLIQMEQMGIIAEEETEAVLNGMAQYKGADSDEKARIREEIKEVKKAEIDGKQEENRTRVEEKMAEVKEKISMLQGAKSKSVEEQGSDNAGDNAGDNTGDNSPGNSGSNAGNNAGGSGKGSGN